MFASASTDGVHVEMALPDRVWKVIVTKYGGPTLCYAIQCGKKVYPGNLLEKQSSNLFQDKVKCSDNEKYGNGHGWITQAMILNSLKELEAMEKEKHSNIYKCAKISNF